MFAFDTPFKFSAVDDIQVGFTIGQVVRRKQCSTFLVPRLRDTVIRKLYQTKWAAMCLR
jgi:hypothetical protein